MQRSVVSSGSQPLLIVFFISSKEWVYFRNIWGWTFKEKLPVLWKVKLFCLKDPFFTQLVFKSSLWIENHWWNVRIFIKNKSRSHLLEEMFRPPYSKSLWLRRAAFEMPLRHGVRGSSFKSPPSVCTKTVSSLFRQST